MHEVVDCPLVSGGYCFLLRPPLLLKIARFIPPPSEAGESSCYVLNPAYATNGPTAIMFPSRLSIIYAPVTVSVISIIRMTALIIFLAWFSLLLDWSVFLGVPNPAVRCRIFAWFIFGEEHNDREICLGCKNPDDIPWKEICHFIMETAVAIVFMKCVLE